MMAVVCLASWPPLLVEPSQGAAQEMLRVAAWNRNTAMTVSPFQSGRPLEESRGKCHLQQPQWCVRQVNKLESAVTCIIVLQASEEDFPPSTPPLEAVSSSSSQQQLLRTHSSLVIQKSDGSCQSEQESTKDDVIFEEQSETLVYSEKTDSMRTEVVAPTTERQESRQDKVRVQGQSAGV